MRLGASFLAWVSEDRNDSVLAVGRLRHRSRTPLTPTNGATVGPPLFRIRTNIASHCSSFRYGELARPAHELKSVHSRDPNPLEQLTFSCVVGRSQTGHFQSSIKQIPRRKGRGFCSRAARSGCRRSGSLPPQHREQAAPAAIRPGRPASTMGLGTAEVPSTSNAANGRGRNKNSRRAGTSNRTSRDHTPQ